MIAKNNYSEIFFNLIKISNKVNYNILTGKFQSITDIKKSYIFFLKQIENEISDNELIRHNGKEVNLKKELMDEIEKLYSVSVRIFRSNYWGEFSKINKAEYPDLYSMMIDKNGDLIRSFDNFNGCVAMMDFHGYTKFSNEIKYNKTPLKEFGDSLPQKLKKICQLFQTIIYELEGDALILVGPPNPLFICNAVLSIIELVRQKPFNKNINPRSFHKIEIQNPAIRAFEMNASVVTGGESFINEKGSIIGTIVAEASRMLKIINTKKPNKSGLIISDKVFRNLIKYKDVTCNSHISIHNFRYSDSFLVDVKGIRLNIREVFLEDKKSFPETEDFTKKLYDEIKKKTSAKWFNILVYYIRLIMTILPNIKISININGENYNNKKLELFLYRNLDNWLIESNPDTIIIILRITNELFEINEEIRDKTALFHEFIHENYKYIIEQLETYFKSNLRIEENNSPAIRKLILSYETEIQKIKDRIFPRRIIETILNDPALKDKLYDIPYIGKK